MILRAARMGWSLLVGAALGLTRTHARRLRPLDFAPFESALAAVPPERDGQIDALLGGTTMARVQELMDVGAFSAEELTLHVLARIRRLDDALCSVIELNPAALDEARACRRAPSVGERPWRAGRHPADDQGQHRDGRPDAHDGGVA